MQQNSLRPDTHHVLKQSKKVATPSKEKSRQSKNVRFSKRGCLAFLTLFAAVFQERKRTLRDKQLLSVLQLRAWILHSIISGMRVFSLIAGVGPWFQEKKFCGGEVQNDCIGVYNEGLLDPIVPIMMNLLKVVIILGTLLDLLIFKWRYLSSLVLHMECLTRLIVLLIPNYASYEHTTATYLYAFTSTFLIYYTDSGSQVIVLTLTFIVHVTFGQAVVYKRPFKISDTIETLLYVILAFIGTSILAMTITFISKLNNRIEQAYEGQKGLLNSMHEGLLIFAEAPARPNLAGDHHDEESVRATSIPLLCNLAARKIVTKFITPAGYNRLVNQEIPIDDIIMNQACFFPI